MIFRSFLSFPAGLSLLATALLPWMAPLSAADLPPREAIIAAARKNLGPEATLEGVTSLLFKGELVSEADKQTGTVAMYFKKPVKQRLEITFSGISEVTAVNGHEGFVERTRLDTKQKQLTIMPADSVERMLANTWENLNFFQEPKQRFATMTVDRRTEYRGRDAFQVTTKYPSGTLFVRYFDAATGQLLATVSDRGLETVEVGQLESGGIKFPRKLEAYQNEKKVHTITFSEILVNPELPDDLFEFPESMMAPAGPK